MTVLLVESSWKYEFQHNGKRYSRRGFPTREAALEAEIGRKYMVTQNIGTLSEDDVIEEFAEGQIRGSHGKRPISYVIDKNGCHICVSHVGDYPAIQRNGKKIKLHRFIYEHAYGPIPEGMVVMHTCDNPRCINPLHLRLGSYSDNHLDKIYKGRAVLRNKRIKPTETSVAWARKFYGGNVQ